MEQTVSEDDAAPAGNRPHGWAAPPTHVRTPWTLPAALILVLAVVVGAAIWDWRWLLPGVAALLLLGAAYEVIANRRLARQHPGEMIDVSGPTVVLEAGLASPGISWATVQTAIAQTNRVVSYDRAGQGWSDRSAHPRTGRPRSRRMSPRSRICSS